MSCGSRFPNAGGSTRRSGQHLQRAIVDLDRVLVIARHSRTALPQFVTTAQVMSEATVIFATDDPMLLALLSSSHALLVGYNEWL